MRFSVKLTFSGKCYSADPHSVGQKNVRNNKPKKDDLVINIKWIGWLGIDDYLCCGYKKMSVCSSCSIM